MKKKAPKKKISKKRTKKKTGNKEETKLEREIKEAENEIKGEETVERQEAIREFLPVTEIKAPVLERIMQRQAPIQPVVGEQRQENERRIDYSVNQPNYTARNTTEEDERKYETNFVPPVLTRRDFTDNSMRREFLKPQERVWGNIDESELNEVEFFEEERKLPFEEQKKYKKYKFR